MHFTGHSLAQTPQPLQKSKSVSGFGVFEAFIAMQPSGQTFAHVPQPMHFSKSVRGMNVRHPPVLLLVVEVGLVVMFIFIIVCSLI